MKCPVCGEEVILGSERCQSCNAPLEILETSPDAKGPRADEAVFEKPLFSAPETAGRDIPGVLPWSVREDKAPKGPISLAGGVLILAGGMISTVNGALILSVSSYVPEIFGLGAFSLTPVCGTLMLLLGLGALVGGILGVFRIKWSIVMATSIVCLISVGWMFLSMVMGFIALILVAISKEDFD